MQSDAAVRRDAEFNTERTEDAENTERRARRGEGYERKMLGRALMSAGGSARVL